ncbi:MAG: hypothetical protein K6L73_07340 [Cellvibrionaceae bacterium]
MKYMALTALLLLAGCTSLPSPSGQNKAAFNCDFASVKNKVDRQGVSPGVMSDVQPYHCANEDDLIKIVKYLKSKGAKYNALSTPSRGLEKIKKGCYKTGIACSRVLERKDILTNLYHSGIMPRAILAMLKEYGDEISFQEGWFIENEPSETGYVPGKRSIEPLSDYDLITILKGKKNYSSVYKFTYAFDFLNNHKVDPKALQRLEKRRLREEKQYPVMKDINRIKDLLLGPSLLKLTADIRSTDYYLDFAIYNSLKVLSKPKLYTNEYVSEKDYGATLLIDLTPKLIAVEEENYKKAREIYMQLLADGRLASLPEARVYQVHKLLAQAEVAFESVNTQSYAKLTEKYTKRSQSRLRWYESEYRHRMSEIRDSLRGRGKPYKSRVFNTY